MSDQDQYLLPEFVQEALSRIKGLLDMLFHSAEDAIFLMDDMRFVDCNPATLRMFGCRVKEDIVGQTPFDFSPARQPDGTDSNERARALVTLALEGAPQHFEWRHCKLDRTEFDVEVRLNRFMVGEKPFLVAVVRDITEHKQAALERERLMREVQTASTAKDRFLSELSHELRNPLAPITLSLDILLHQTPGGARAERAREVIRRQVGQLTRLIDDLLDVTRIRRQKIQLRRQRLELCELLRCTIEDHRPLFENAGVELEFEPAARPAHVNGDWDRLIQVFSNLLQNAAKFTGRGGHTRVSVSTDPASRRAVVRVADTGIGIAPELLGRLFSPFAQQEDTGLDRSKGGLGLGLALVKGLVELHGGEVAVTSEGPGKGAEFTVRLPLDMDGAETPREERRAEAPAQRRVLVIEDNVDAAESMRDALAFRGHEIEVAYDGPTGIAKARRFRPDVVFCDIGLPGMDGYEVARILRSDEALKNVFLVALTGYAQPDDVRQAAEAGFDRHLAKPPRFRALEELLARLP